MKKMTGVITALITPFLENKVDYKSLQSLIQYQLENGVQGFVINGTTGESPTLLPMERAEIFKFIQSRVPKDFPLINTMPATAIEFRLFILKSSFSLLTALSDSMICFESSSASVIPIVR